MPRIADVLGRSPRRLEFQLAITFSIVLTCWSIAVAAWTDCRTPNIADFAQFAEPGSWRTQRKIVYLFTPAFLQGIASLLLAIPLFPQCQSQVRIGFIPRRLHLLLLILFVIFWLCDAHLRSIWVLRSTESAESLDARATALAHGVNICFVTGQGRSGAARAASAAEMCANTPSRLQRTKRL